MRWKHWFALAAVLVLITAAETFAQVPKIQTRTIRMLRNRDVLAMVRTGVKSDQIIANILTSPCNFDVFPPVLEDLRRRGVPESVLQVMTVVPNGPPNLPEVDSPGDDPYVKTVKVKMLRGLPVMVETLYPVSSADFKVNNTIAFSVTRPVFIDGALVIPRGTIARARIISAKKAKRWGRGGALTFEMEYITAIDGTRVPVQLSSAIEGGNRTGVLAMGAAATSALIFPYTAPVAIVWGFKKGDDAVVRGSKEFAAVLKTDTEIAGLVPDKERVIYHYAESLKAKQAGSTTGTKFPRLGVRK